MSHPTSIRRAVLIAVTLMLGGCGRPTGEPSRTAHEPSDPGTATVGRAKPVAASPIAAATRPAPPAPPPDAAPPTKPRLVVQPLGKIGDDDLATVRTAIESVYGWEVEVLEPTKHPAAAWYKPRKRWRAEKILDWLRPRLPTGAKRIMALTADDISTTKGKVHDWGICGLADIDAEAAVVSTFRIKKALGRVAGKSKRAQYRERLRDLAAHEFGHTLGLPHCPTQGCIMEDAKGTVLTFDRSTGALCDQCLGELRAAGYPMP